MTSTEKSNSDIEATRSTRKNKRIAVIVAFLIVLIAGIVVLYNVAASNST